MQSAVGFEADADDMAAILDAEFERAAVPPAARVAIAGGHSRGHISALTFKMRHAATYARVLVLSLDGSYCGYAEREDILSYYTGIPSMVALYVVSPLLPLAAGARPTSTAAAPATATASATLRPSGFIAMTRASGRPSRTFSASGISYWIEPSAPRVCPSARRTASWNARRSNAPATVASSDTAPKTA